MRFTKPLLIGGCLMVVSCSDNAPPPPPAGTALAVQACLSAYRVEFTESVLAACAYRHSEDLPYPSAFFDGGAAFRFSCLDDDCEAVSFDGNLRNQSSVVIVTSFTVTARFGESQSDAVFYSPGSVFIEPGETFEFSVPRRSFARVPTRADIPLDASDGDWSWNLERARGFRLLPPTAIDADSTLTGLPALDP
jgi:hypothetical protein